MASSELPLSPDEKAVLSMRSDEFHVALSRGTATDLSPYLEGLTGDVRLAVLTELAVIELGHRWENGEQPGLEEYVERYPELGPPGSEPPALREEYERCRDRAGVSAMATRHSKSIPMPAERVLPKPPAPEPETDYAERATRTVLASGKAPVVTGGPGAEGLHGVAQNYELIRELGRGAYGEVWLARKMPSGIEKAVKILHQPADQETAQRELRSLELIKNLRHPYLLATEDFWVANNKLYIVTELADSSLRRRLVECKEEGFPGIPEDELFTYTLEAAEGFDYLHSKMITHRDVKPDNILILNGHAKVADFGLARQHDSPEVAVMSFAGTPAYMAPEVWGGEGGPPSDLYGFAMTYVELRQGRTPFKLGKVMEVMQSHMSGQFDFADAVTEPEREVLRRALSKDPANRHPSCLAFVEDLAEALGRPMGKRAGAPRPPREGISVAGVDTGKAVATVRGTIVDPLTAAPPKRPKAWLLGGIAAAIGAIVLVAVLANGGKKNGDGANLVLPGGAVAEGEEVVELADGRKPPKWIVVEHNGEKARFRFIVSPPTAPRTGPFYMLQSKVWNKLFGGNGEGSVPALNVTANQAAEFAARLGGRLPTPDEWDVAAGFYDSRKSDGPYKPESNLRIKSAEAGPTVGPEASLNANQNELIDMAANGREWTCAVLPARGQPFQIVEGASFPVGQLVVLRGRNFTLKSPLTFAIMEREKTDPQTQFADVPSPYTTFRIVLPLKE